MMKKVSIIIPTYNEDENVIPLTAAIKSLFLEKLSQYDYEIVFIDNYSKDSTRLKLEGLCAMDQKVKAIFNAKNFGQLRSPFYGMMQTKGDCTILMCADFQDPIELIVDFLREWENGYRIVIGIKNKSKESKLMYFFRSCYYKTIGSTTEVDHISHFTGFGLYDKTFIDVLRNLDDPVPYLRGIVAELGFERKEIPYVQAKRRAGKTKNNFFSLYDIGMLGITSYTKVIMRTATFIGFFASAISMLIALITVVFKLFFWNEYPVGSAAVLTGVFLIGSIQLFFIGFLGEYILNINTRVMKRPLVVEDKRINF